MTLEIVRQAWRRAAGHAKFFDEQDSIADNGQTRWFRPAAEKGNLLGFRVEFSCQVKSTATTTAITPATGHDDYDLFIGRIQTADLQGTGADAKPILRSDTVDREGPEIVDQILCNSRQYSYPVATTSIPAATTTTVEHILNVPFGGATMGAVKVYIPNGALSLTYGATAAAKLTLSQRNIAVYVVESDLPDRIRFIGEVSDSKAKKTVSLLDQQVSEMNSDYVAFYNAGASSNPITQLQGTTQEGTSFNLDQNNLADLKKLLLDTSMFPDEYLVSFDKQRLRTLQATLNSATTVNSLWFDDSDGADVLPAPVENIPPPVPQPGPVGGGRPTIPRVGGRVSPRLVGPG